MNASIHRLPGVLAIIVVTLPTSAGANAPAGQYVVTAGGTGNGTVYDTKSRLTWQQTASSTMYTWVDAKTYCAGVGASLGGTGWRLPTLKELQSLVDYSQSTGPMIDPNAFPATSRSFFWSATPFNPPSEAWGVNFDLGITGTGVVSEEPAPPLARPVRCVR
jgi:hypothetical protein